MEFLLYYTTAFAFAVAAAIGSFLNVVIYRVPEGLSVVKPASRCPSCMSEIRWYDNIPIFSWFWLGAKCRRCGVRISGRYALVEFLTASVGAFIWYQRFQPVVASGAVLDQQSILWVVVPSIFYFLFACLLIVISFVDLDHFLIPHEFTVPGMVVGLALPWILGAIFGDGYILYMWPPVTAWTSIAGFISGGLIIVIVFYAYLAFRGVEGMGGGDVTLMALVGAWLGWPSLVFVLFASSLQGLLAAGLSVFWGIDFVKDSREIFDDDDPDDDDVQDDVEQGEAMASATDADDEEYGRAAIPFGPFISLSALEYLLFGAYLPPEISMIHFFY